jgi:hypothetical protein
MIPILVAGLLAFSIFRPGPIPPGIYTVISASGNTFIRMDTRDASLESCTFTGEKEYQCEPLEQKGKI